VDGIQTDPGECDSDGDGNADIVYDADTPVSEDVGGALTWLYETVGEFSSCPYQSPTDPVDCLNEAIEE
jgi:hypothetical protein